MFTENQINSDLLIFILQTQRLSVPFHFFNLSFLFHTKKELCITNFYFILQNVYFALYLFNFITEAKFELFVYIKCLSG